MRATRDVDFAIAVDSWERFATVLNGLLLNQGFRASERIDHRVIFTSATINDVPVDIIPFGGIAAKDGTIAWPRDIDVVMNVAGFEEALSAAVQISVVEDLTIPVVSLPGLAILKLFAWADRRVDKDATDLYWLIRSYVDAGNEDRLYDSDLPEAFGFDMELAGASLLGSDVTALCTIDTLQKLVQTFSGNTIEKLRAQMYASDSGVFQTNRTVKGQRMLAFASSEF